MKTRTSAGADDNRSRDVTPNFWYVLDRWHDPRDAWDGPIVTSVWAVAFALVAQILGYAQSSRRLRDSEERPTDPCTLDYDTSITQPLSASDAMTVGTSASAYNPAARFWVIVRAPDGNCLVGSQLPVETAG